MSQRITTDQPLTFSFFRANARWEVRGHAMTKRTNRSPSWNRIGKERLPTPRAYMFSRLGVLLIFIGGYLSDCHFAARTQSSCWPGPNLLFPARSQLSSLRDPDPPPGRQVRCLGQCGSHSRRFRTEIPPGYTGFGRINTCKCHVLPK